MIVEPPSEKVSGTISDGGFAAGMRKRCQGLFSTEHW
jgi:hypothetical protein